jgi:hypothetical protein
MAWALTGGEAAVSRTGCQAPAVSRAQPLPPSLLAGPFALSDALALGINANRLRRTDIVHPYRGVSTTLAPSTLLEQRRAYRVRMKPGQAFSHSTAAALLGLPLPVPEDGTLLHVCSVRPAAEPRALGVVGHRLAVAPQVLDLAELRVCAHAEAWCQLGAMLGLDDLVIAADHLLEATSLTEAEGKALLDTVICRTRRRGSESLRRAMVEARKGSRSPGETRVRLLLCRAGLPEPELNGRVVDVRGRFLGTGDLVWRRYRVVLEYEGAHHGSDPEQFRYDVERYERFRDAGWTVVRVTAADLRGGRRDALVARMRLRLGLA